MNSVYAISMPSGKTYSPSLGTAINLATIILTAKIHAKSAPKKTPVIILNLSMRQNTLENPRVLNHMMSG